MMDSYQALEQAAIRARKKGAWVIWVKEGQGGGFMHKCNQDLSLGTPAAVLLRQEHGK